MPVTSPRVAGYVRVSSEEQAEEGVSLDAQEARLRAYATMRGLDLVAIVRDAAVSAGKPLARRRGGQRVLDLIADGEVDGVLAWKLDRVFRDCAECLTRTKEWDAAGVGLHLVDVGGQAVDTRSPMGRFFLTMMAGAAELERAQVIERTRLAMRHKRAQGEYLGGKTPYGQRPAPDGVHVEVDPREAEVLALARALKAQGESLRAISSKLAAQGHLARTGKPFAPTQVARMVAA